MVNCLNEGITWFFVGDILLEGGLTLGDVFFDFWLVYTLIQDMHYRWAVCSIIAILAPGITSVIALSMDGRGIKTKEVFFQRLSIVLFYPFWICLLCWRTIKDKAKLPLMLHLKSYEGLLEASFQFLVQLVIFFMRTPVGNMKTFGHFVRNGEFWLRLTSTIVSLLAFTYGVSRYHCLLDKNYKLPPVLKVMPYFLVHILFRTFTVSLLFIYSNRTTFAFPFLLLVCLTFVNMFFTRKTMKETNHQGANPRFSYTVGGIISMFTPALGCSYGEGASGRTVKAYYRINIFIVNSALMVSFVILAICLNFAGHDNQKRFPLLSCNRNHTWIAKDFGLNENGLMIPTEPNFMFLGKTWEVRQKPKSINSTYTTQDCIEGPSTVPCIPYFLVAQNCTTENEGEAIEKFNIIIIPIVFFLGALSTLTAFCSSILAYKHDILELGVDEYNY